MNKILIYGATGYTGKLCARELVRHGLEPILAARGKHVQQTAETLGCRSAIFDLKNEALLLKNLRGVELVINLAGPFSMTQNPLIKACVTAQCHYLDIAGEVEEVRSAFLFDSQAKNAGLMVMPGAGFGVVPTDVAAKLVSEVLPDASQLTLAYATEGGASRGTLKTVLNSINATGYRRLNHTLVPARPAEASLDFTVAGKKFTAVYNPWRADLFTAGLSTNIPNIETYAVFPGFVVRMMKGRGLWLRDLILNRLLRFLPEGPSEKQLRKGATYVIAVAKNSDGEKRAVSVKGPEAYLFTARCLVQLAKKLLSGTYEPGFQPPSYYGKEILDKIENVEIYQNGI